MTTKAAIGLRVEDVMNANPVSIMPNATLKELGRVLDSYEISGVPVVDAQDRVLGVVSKTDLVHYFIDTPESGEVGSVVPMTELDEEEFTAVSELIEETDTIVQEIMSTETVTATPNEPLHSVARRMAEEQVHRVIVVDQAGHLQGIVTSLDALAHFPA